MACTAFLEKIRWSNNPICPYCKLRKASPLPKEQRYHCNICNSSYSVTSGTIFHRSHLPLQKWFLAICLVLNSEKFISTRRLANDLRVNKDTAWLIMVKIKRFLFESRELLFEIAKVAESNGVGMPKAGENSQPKT